jgi:hypothetical protein
VVWVDAGWLVANMACLITSQEALDLVVAMKNVLVLVGFMRFGVG